MSTTTELLDNQTTAPSAPSTDETGMKAVYLDPNAVHGPPVTLSVCLIVKNEILHIDRVLKSVRGVADEIIVVDTGSTDETVARATELGAQVEHFTWCDDFAAARNFAFSKCTKDWILWIDADDVLTQDSVKFINSIKGTILTHKELRTIFAPYHYEYHENGTVAVNLNRERILRNGIGHKWLGKIHETLENPWPYSLRLEQIVVEHRTDKSLYQRKEGRNLRIFEQYINIETDSLRELFLYGSELQQVGRLEDAEKVLLKYIERLGDKVDMVGEKYSVYIKLADVYYNQKNLAKASDFCYLGLKLDPTRAECAALLGVIYYTAGFPAAAYPWCVYATLCPTPSWNTSLVVQKLFWEVPMQMVGNIFQQVDSATMTKRLSEVSALVNRIAVETKGEKAKLERMAKKNAAKAAK